MFVLGIDPGLSRCGYGLVKKEKGILSGLAAGTIETDPTEPIHLRLAVAGRALRELMKDLSPEVVVVERVFFQVNALTAMSVGQASGLALAAAADQGCDVVQYTSNEVKQALVGYGSATKQQVQKMVAQVLSLSALPNPPDIADALALGICHATTMSLRKAVDDATQGERTSA